MKREKKQDVDSSLSDLSKLRKLTGLDAKIIKKACDGGYFPKPDKGFYEVVPTIRGCYEYLVKDRGTSNYGGSQTLPVYASQKVCAAATGISVIIQRYFKSAGCDAFRFARVDLGKLILAMAGELGKMIGGESTSLVGASGNVNQELVAVKTQRELIKLEKDRGLVVNRADAQSAWHAAESELFAAIDRVLCNELPPVVVGLTELEISARCKRQIGDCKSRLRERLSKWLEEQEGKAP